MQTCKTCRAPILWAKTETGRAIPLDLNPVLGGNIRIENGIAIYEKPQEGVPGFVTHFATCPQRVQHRRPDPGPDRQAVDRVRAATRKAIEEGRTAIEGLEEPELDEP